MWIYGRRGAGKSTVLAYVVDDLLRSGESYLIGYSFLDGTLNHRDPLADSLESLTHQLIEHGTYAGSHGSQSPLTYLCQLESPLRPEAFRSYLRVLFAAIKAQTCTILILDGFDAWDWIYAPFIEEVERAKKAQKIIKCLFASRRPPDTILPYPRLLTICIGEQGGHRRNLYEFIRAKLPGVQSEKLQEHPDWQSYAKQVCSRSNGNFLWGEMIIGILSHRGLDTLATPSDSATDLLSLDLNCAYDQIMGAVPGADRSVVYNLLSCLVAGYRPLSIQELCSITSPTSPSYAAVATSCIESIERRIETKLRRTCALLVTITSEKTVSLRHSTVREYLSSRFMDRGVNQMLIHGHELIAEACVRDPILFGRSMKPFLLSSKGFLARSLGPSEANKWQEYASIYWKTHYLQAEPYSKTLPGILQHILTNQFSHDSEHLAHSGSSRFESVAQLVLAFSAVQGLTILTRIYLSMGIDPTTTPCGCCPSPLNLVTAHGSKDMVEMLLRSKALTQEQDDTRTFSGPAVIDDFDPSDCITLVLRCDTDACSSATKASGVAFEKAAVDTAVVWPDSDTNLP